MIGSIKDKFKKFQVKEKMDQSVNLKRANSTSPVGIKAKSVKITQVCDDIETPKTLKLKLSEMEEDLKLVKKECEDVKVENSLLRSKHLEEVNVLKQVNINLIKQLKNQELEAVKAMKVIEQQIEEETNTAVKLMEKQIEYEVEKKMILLATAWLIHLNLVCTS